MSLACGLEQEVRQRMWWVVLKAELPFYTQHARTRTHTATDTHARTHARTHAYANTDSVRALYRPMHTDWCIHALRHTLSLPLSLSLSLSLSLIYRPTQVHARSACTHVHVYTRRSHRDTLTDRQSQYLLRLSTFNLNYDLFRRHLLQDPICSCRYTEETSEHFLLQCPLYNSIRNKTINKLDENEISVHFCLETTSHIYKLIRKYLL